MTVQEMLEAEKYWCENCCNFDKEHSLPDGYANCKVTNMLTFGQCCGKECKFFNVPAENVIVTPCKVGDTVYFINRAFDSEISKAKVIRVEINYYTPENPIWLLLEVHSKRIGKFEHHSRTDFMFGNYVFLTKEEAQKALQVTGK